MNEVKFDLSDVNISTNPLIMIPEMINNKPAIKNFLDIRNAVNFQLIIFAIKNTIKKK